MAHEDHMTERGDLVGDKRTKWGYIEPEDASTGYYSEVRTPTSKPPSKKLWIYNRPSRVINTTDESNIDCVTSEIGYILSNEWGPIELLFSFI